MEIRQMKEKNRKKLLVSNIIPFESGTTNSQNPEEVNCHWQSMCYKNPLGFNISRREKFSESGSLTVMKIYNESALMQISQEFGSL